MNTRSILVLSVGILSGLACSTSMAQPAGHDHPHGTPAKADAPQPDKDQQRAAASTLG